MIKYTQNKAMAGFAILSPLYFPCTDPPFSAPIMTSGLIRLWPRIKRCSIQRIALSRDSFWIYPLYLLMFLGYCEICVWMNQGTLPFKCIIFRILIPEISSSDKVTIGFITLRGLVLQRPSLRTEALNTLLELTTHPGKGIQHPIIITVNVYPQTKRHEQQRSMS